MISKKIQSIIILLLFLIIICFLFFYIINMYNNSKYNVMKMSAKRFGEVVTNNYNSFDEYKERYLLDEMINLGYMKDIKSPFSNNNCSRINSYVDMKDGIKVTLKCDDYIIYEEDYNKDIDIYILDSNTSDNCININLYNCKDNDNLIFEEYSDDDLFIKKINNKFNTNYNNINDIINCSIVNENKCYSMIKV